jgi:hypothetical protein
MMTESVLPTSKSSVGTLLNDPQRPRYQTIEMTAMDVTTGLK